MAQVFLGLGSNIGNRVGNLDEAIEKLDSHENISVVRQSSIIETEPYGHVEQDKFMNMCIEINTNLSPVSLLDAVLDIEQQMGRVRIETWGPRNIDIDILLYEDLEIDLQDLQIPHGELQKRMFVLEPLAEIAPNFIHPVFKESIKTLKQRLEQSE
ncbi:2-amino-4-hydroxy-6-hydroxymethyldihydropteridine diphosphokinase [Aliicoccus persicus]|uniref:2-amino-4-hydroxy-6-hydroxymethyldihydropteridine diphosphokinase n=1 Tax=Aliicoccus persicus TaxID=930138 RepID=A0A662Z5R8_9STAP|nr:2-amino-4-hydroxy-6-hydroxymethyldihydropteridine diphosphokinase [Aliicoccus persicus]SEW06184.1 2-amino-4-hydroxy-6-hydroxymethyldihydropteridinediphosphokinase [Aliicoccus persicus]